MHIRPWKPGDLPRTADISAAAMLDNEIFEYLCPKRREYYSSFRFLLLRMQKLRLSSLGWVLRVAVTDAENFGPHDIGGEVIGCAAWKRIGDDPAASKWKIHNSGWGSWLELSLLNIQERYYKFFRLDRSVDESLLANYIATAKNAFPSDIFPEMWYLASLSIDPDYQRRGVGTLLTNWGLDQSRAESVPVGLEASIKGSGMYEKLGFRVLHQLEWKEGHWVTVMIWDSSGEDREGNWFERAKKAVDARKHSNIR